MNKAQYKLVSLTALGGALEFYDFTIYALFAPYLSQHFFSNTAPLVSLINTFSVFALGCFDNNEWKVIYFFNLYYQNIAINYWKCD